MKFIKTLQGEAFSSPPIWFMRQAGRYLPEYRATRAEAGSFLDLCYNSDLAAEVTLQPIRRYGLDAAILFADILLVPHALGQRVDFVQGEGPVLDPVSDSAALARLDLAKIHETLSPVYETMRILRRELPEDVALIGFAGAPWTVATYMIAGGSSRDPAALRSFYYRDPEFVTALVDMLVEATGQYLVRQVEAGADAIQLFDTWAGGLPEPLTETLSLAPMRRLAQIVKQASPSTPVILFPKGVGVGAKAYAAAPECDGLGIDFSMPWDWARENLSPHTTVQGGLDPLLVVAGGEEMSRAAVRLRDTFAGAPYVFNLGHGFTPETPPDNVAELVKAIRQG